MADETSDLNVNIKGDASGVENASKRASAAVGTVSSEAKQLDAAFRRLKSAIDPTFAATEKYNRLLADNEKLLKAGRISQDEYAQGARAAKLALDAQIASITQNSAAVRAAAAAQRQANREAAATEREAAASAAREARAAAQAKRQAEIAAAREAAAAEREAKAEVKRLAREAAEEAKRAAQEKLAAERKASQEAAEAERRARREQRQAIRDAAQEAARAAQERKAADRAAREASQEAARATRDQARAEREASQAVRDLKSAIDPAFAAQQRYNDTMARATALLMQNRLNQGEWIQIQRQAAAQMEVNTRSMGRMNAVSVQMGYQMQDVVASWASGINPLVILAQQGGQTASALAMMGGKVGMVASFFAGPWGAAIIGATMLLGMYIQKTKESEKATKDATSAEDLRKMKLQELTQALKDFNKEQREANMNSSAQRSQNVATANTQLNEAGRRVAQYQNKLAAARQELKMLLNGTIEDESGVAILMTQRKVTNLEKSLKAAQAAAKEASSALAQTRLAQIGANAAGAADEREAIRLRYEQEETAIKRNYAAQIAAANGIKDAAQRRARVGQIELATEQQLTAATKKRMAAEEALSKSKRDASGAPAAARRAAREALKEAKSDLEDLIESYTYEQSVAGENYAEILRLQDLKIAAIKKFYGDESKEASRAARERVTQERQYQAQILQEQQQGIEARLNAAEAEVTRNAEIARIAAETKGDRTGFRENTGAINASQAVAERRAQLDEMYQAEVDFENRLYALRVRSIQDRLALENLPVKVKAELNQQLETLEAQHNQKLAVMAAQNTRAVAQSNLQSAEVIANKWRQTASTISQSLTSSFQGIWTGTMSWQQAMFNLADQLTYRFVDAGAKILENWIVQQATKASITSAGTAAETGIVVAGEAAKTSATAAGTAARVGVTASGAAATTSITATSALASIGADAARAAAGAYAAIAGIPVIGPFLAPAAAGAALVAVMALGSKIASARGGQWQVPQDGQLTELHRDEMVLPAWAAKPLRANLSAPSSAGMMGRAANAGQSIRSANENAMSSSRSDSHYWSIQAMDARSFQRFLEDNPRALQSAMRKQTRNTLGRN